MSERGGATEEVNVEFDVLWMQQSGTTEER